MDTPTLSFSNTTHTTHYTDALKGLKQLEDETVNLTVTSPPYPMIEMWDEIFANCSPKINTAIENNNWQTAYEEMHNYLNKIWNQLIRVTTTHGIIAINIGNATRRVNNSFKLYPNIQPIINHFTQNGCEMLPYIHWHKASNKSSSFMGSGTLPTNAYITNDTEYILLFRKGTGTRNFPPNDTQRYQSTFFWEERNDWFSDRWTFQGTSQTANHGNRDRTGAYPLELPYRLINMYSIYGDTILDPFLGTGTTQLAASILGRNSIGYEIDTQLQPTLLKQLNKLKTQSNEKMSQRVTNHKQFVKNTDYNLPYESHYGPVKTKYEQNILFPQITNTTIKTQTNETLKWETTFSTYHPQQ